MAFFSGLSCFCPCQIKNKLCTYKSRGIRFSIIGLHLQHVHTCLSAEEEIFCELVVCFCIHLESEQITGSFKVRGAFNKLLSLKESKDEVFLTKGVITASSGNHGAATVCLMVFSLSKCIIVFMFQGESLSSIFPGHA